jgi:hypothetical protein
VCQSRNINIAGDPIRGIAIVTNHHLPSMISPSRQKYLVLLADSPHPLRPMPDLAHDHDHALARIVTEATASQLTDRAGPRPG